MNKEDYSKYLNHPLWQKKRNEVFLKYGKRCSVSGCNCTNHLEIHHKTYTPDKMPWEYPIENFIVLCEKHHSEHHGYEYTFNTCKGKGCKREISNKYDYCLPCHNKLIEEKEIEKKELEKIIKDLEESLKSEIGNKTSNGKDKMSKEIKRLNQEKCNLEKTISELKSTDNEFKDGIISDIKSIEFKIIQLEKEKYNKESKSQIRKDQLENEITLLREEMNNLKNILPESNNVKDIKEEVIANNKRIESKINSLMKGLGILAAIIILPIIVFVFWSSKAPTNINQTPLMNNNANAYDKNKVLPASNETNNPQYDATSNTVNPVQVPEAHTNTDQDVKPKTSTTTHEKDEISLTNKNEENIIHQNEATKINTDSNKQVMSSTQLSYKTISIEEISSNMGNKVKLHETISQVIYAVNGNAYLNIGGIFPRQKLSLVIFKSNINDFGDLGKYENKRVTIKGKLTYYRNRPQIIVNQNWQMLE